MCLPLSDQIYVVDDGRMELQTDLDLHGHKLMNNRQGGFSFDSRGVINMHDDMNTNGTVWSGETGWF